MRFFIIGCLFLTLSWRFVNLTSQEIEENGVPELSSTLDSQPSWKSSLYWSCYPTSIVSTRVVFVEYPGMERDMPEIVVKINNLTLTFALPPEYDSFEKEALRNWKQLLKDEDMICLYAVNLPNPSTEIENEFIFYIEKIKTNKGVWEVRPYEESLHPDEVK